MENVKAAYDKMYALDSEHDGNYKHCIESESLYNEYLESLIMNIKNKLLSMNGDNKLFYSSMICKEIEYRHEQFEIDIVFNGDVLERIKNKDSKIEDFWLNNPKNHITDIESWFLHDIINAFRYCDIDIYDKVKNSLYITDEDGLFVLNKDNRRATNYTNRTFTAPRQIIAIQSLLSELGVDTLSTDKTKITAFIQFLTGRQPDALPQNTTLYKLIDTATKDIDYTFVAEQFDKIGLTKLSQKLKNASF